MRLVPHHILAGYLTKPDCLFIVTVIHGSQDLAGRENKPWDEV